MPTIASASNDETVRLWDTVRRICTATFRRRSMVRSIAIMGALVAIGDDEGVYVIEPGLNREYMQKVLKPVTNQVTRAPSNSGRSTTY